MVSQPVGAVLAAELRSPIAKTGPGEAGTVQVALVVTTADMPASIFSFPVILSGGLCYHKPAQ